MDNDANWADISEKIMSQKPIDISEASKETVKPESEELPQSKSKSLIDTEAIVPDIRNTKITEDLNNQLTDLFGVKTEGKLAIRNKKGVTRFVSRDEVSNDGWDPTKTNKTYKTKHKSDDWVPSRGVKDVEPISTRNFKKRKEEVKASKEFKKARLDALKRKLLKKRSQKKATQENTCGSIGVNMGNIPKDPKNKKVYKRKKNALIKAESKLARALELAEKIVECKTRRKNKNEK